MSKNMKINYLMRLKQISIIHYWLKVKTVPSGARINFLVPAPFVILSLAKIGFSLIRVWCRTKFLNIEKIVKYVITIYVIDLLNKVF